ncbi:hypothetical protein GCM10023158_34520 [Gluconacetobacter tumulicola]
MEAVHRICDGLDLLFEIRSVQSHGVFITPADAQGGDRAEDDPFAGCGDAEGALMREHFGWG